MTQDNTELPSPYATLTYDAQQWKVLTQEDQVLHVENAKKSLAKFCSEQYALVPGGYVKQKKFFGKSGFTVILITPIDMHQGVKVEIKKAEEQVEVKEIPNEEAKVEENQPVVAERA